MGQKITFGWVLLLISTSWQVWGQDLHIKRATSPVKLDGVMDEPVWAEAEVADHFHQLFPYDTSEAIVPTEVRMTYDDNNLYVIAILHNLGPREYVTPSLRRDYRGAAFDGFSLVLDTYKDKTNGFLFGVNPWGVQREGLISNGGNFSGSGGGFSLTWDNKWYSAAKTYDDYWIAEMAIPFKTIRYKENLDSWYINFYRIDSEHGERSTWSPIPRNFRVINLAFNKQLLWDEPPRSAGKNISLIPYTALKASKNYEEQTPRETGFALGGDAKLAVTTALNLDLTVNPDFSQVETDAQVTNLDRFEIFFPEQRQFFLENADLFSSFGTSGAQPFFSRRIGITRDTATGTNLQNPLYFGARLSGNLNKNWRMGLLSVQAATEEDIGLPSVNYTVASFQRRIGQRSNIAAQFVNKQAFQDTLGESLTFNPSAWNRTLAVDLNLATPDNRLSSKVYYHQSFEASRPDSAYSLGIGLNYQTYRWQINSDFRSIGVNFNPEVGFVRRTDFRQTRGTAFYNFYPAKGIVQSHGPGFDFDMVFNQTYGLMDWDANMLYRINFKNTSRFSGRLRRQYTYLFSAFDPSGTGGQELAEDSDYAYNFALLSFNSDQRKPFFYEITAQGGEYFNGNRLRLEGTLSYRFIPRMVTSLNFQVNRIRLPEPYNDADLFLIAPRVDITFTRKIFWTTFIQFNNQINNVNLNTRFQYRYSPVSDLFIVYSDNYFAELGNGFIDFQQPKSRGLVVKLTYWFNT